MRADRVRAGTRTSLIPIFRCVVVSQDGPGMVADSLRHASGRNAEDRLAQESIAAALKAKRSELMRSQLEDVALRLFEARGFGDVTVEDVAAAAQISVRTFYRYFPSKDLLLQVRIDRRSAALQAA